MNYFRILSNFSRVFMLLINDELFPMVSLEFFIDIILPAALWSWG